MYSQTADSPLHFSGAQKKLQSFIWNAFCYLSIYLCLTCRDVSCMLLLSDFLFAQSVASLAEITMASEIAASEIAAAASSRRGEDMGDCPLATIRIFFAQPALIVPWKDMGRAKAWLMEECFSLMEETRAVLIQKVFVDIHHGMIVHVRSVSSLVVDEIVLPKLRQLAGRGGKLHRLSEAEVGAAMLRDLHY